MRSFNDEYSEIEQSYKDKTFMHRIEYIKSKLSKKALVLYGAGAIGISAASVLKCYGLDIACFCDKNKTGVQKETGLAIISPQTLIREYSDANIVICSFNFEDEIKRELCVLGIDSESIFTRGALNLHEMTPEKIKPYLSGYERAYNLYSDDKSKKILMERIKYYLTSSPMSSSPPLSQYFDSEIMTPSNNEIFVDAGLYTGDTAENFFKWVGGKYKHFYGFEPDMNNCKKARRYLAEKSNITVIPKGLWSCETRLNFSGKLESSSRLDEKSGENSVEVTALDAYFSGKSPPTFIKMDIEGAELEALKGSMNIISRYKPKLAICVYHKPEDIYAIPELINSYCGDYKFYLRHYTNSIYETVLYAI